MAVTKKALERFLGIDISEYSWKYLDKLINEGYTLTVEGGYYKLSLQRTNSVIDWDKIERFVVTTKEPGGYRSQSVGKEAVQAVLYDEYTVERYTPENVEDRPEGTDEYNYWRCRHCGYTTNISKRKCSHCGRAMISNFDMDDFNLKPLSEVSKKRGDVFVDSHGQQWIYNGTEWNLFSYPVNRIATDEPSQPGWGDRSERQTEWWNGEWETFEEAIRGVVRSELTRTCGVDTDETDLDKIPQLWSKKHLVRLIREVLVFEGIAPDENGMVHPPTQSS